MRRQEEHHVKIVAPSPPPSAGPFSSTASDATATSSKSAASRSSPQQARRRHRTISGSKSEDHLLTTASGRLVYTKGRPPWYDSEGKNLKHPYVIGICGGSASGKTTVARRIIERLEVPWVTVLSMDSFYKVLTEEHHQQAHRQEYNFDHPQAFDFDLICETIRRLREGKSVEVPVYDFTTHRRDKQPKIMYGADVLIFEGILAFHTPELVKLMDMKVFVDTDPDTRLCRRLQRDTEERGRTVEGVLEQYLRFVKPAFDTFIAPCMKHADIIVPRGGENEVAIDLIAKQVKTQLLERGYDASKNMNPQREKMAHRDLPQQPPSSLHIVDQTPQVRGLHTFIRNKNTPRDEFIFYSERLMRILIENAMNFMPFESVTVDTPMGQKFSGKRCSAEICGISIMRAGESMENSLRAVVKDCKMGKILIQTNPRTTEPELYYSRLPKKVAEYKVLLMDATVATGAAAMMAIRILLDHDVLEENIMLVSLLMAEAGVHSLAYAFPKVTLLTTALDAQITESYHVIPGMGNFGDRYFGTDIPQFDDESDAGPSVNSSSRVSSACGNDVDSTSTHRNPAGLHDDEYGDDDEHSLSVDNLTTAEVMTNGSVDNIPDRGDNASGKTSEVSSGKGTPQTPRKCVNFADSCDMMKDGYRMMNGAPNGDDTETSSNADVVSSE